MPQPPRLATELSALEERRARSGLSPAEEARLAELRSRLAPPPAARGFDVNAAAAAIREELGSPAPPAPSAPLDLGALGPRTPPLEAAVSPELLGLAPEPPAADPEAGPGAPFSGPPPEAELFAPVGLEPAGEPPAPAGPVTPQGYDEVPAFESGAALAASLATASETAGWDPSAPAAPGDEQVVPGDPGAPQATAWEPAPPAPWDPAAAGPSWDPGQPAQADPPAAEPGWDPGQPAPWDPTAAAPSWDPGDPGRAEPAGAEPEATMQWDPRGEAAAAPGPFAGVPEAETASWDLGRPPAPPGQAAPEAAGAGEEFLHEPPAGWAAELGEGALDRLECTSSGSFPPLDLSGLPDAPAAPPATDPAPPLAGDQALGGEALASPDGALLDFELPPMTPAEEAILEVGGDVQELEAGELGETEPVELVEEVTKPVPEFADPLAAGPPQVASLPPDGGPPDVAGSPAEGFPEPVAPLAVPPPPEPARAALAVEAPPPEPPAAPVPAERPSAAGPPPPAQPPAQGARAEEEAWGPEITEEEPPASPLPPLASAFVPPPPPGEPVPLDAIGIEEAAPEPAPEPAPFPRALSGAFRVVLHTVEGQVRRGTLHDPVLDGREVVLESGSGLERLPGDRIRAIFFMLAAGEPPHDPCGRKVRVTFRDGRQVAGFSPDYDPGAAGFFMIPAETRTNTARIWVYRDAVRQVSVGDA